MACIVDLIRQANPERASIDVSRRCLKLLEELGEVAEALLNVTSARNGKAKTWADVREEIADVLIVAVDLALTPMGHDDSETDLAAVVTRLADTEVTPFFFAEEIMFDIAKGAGELRGCYGARLGERTALLAEQAAMDAADLALCALPDQSEATASDLRAALEAEVARKLGKWTQARASRADVTEFVK